MGIEAGKLLQGFGAGFSAVGAYNQAKGEKAALNAQAQTELNNVQLAQYQAEDAVARGGEEANRAQLRGAQMKGRQRAAMAANGVDLSYGSALEIITDTDYLSAIDVATIQQNAAREAWGYRVQGGQALDRARALREGAKQIKPWLSAGTSLLSSATSVASKWYSSANSGAGSGYDPLWGNSGLMRGNRGSGD